MVTARIHKYLVPMEKHRIAGLPTILSHPLGFWKQTLLRIRGTTAAFFQVTLGDYTLKFQPEASSTVHTLKQVLSQIMAELSFQQETGMKNGLEWYSYAVCGAWSPQWAEALWKDKGLMLGVW